MYTVVQVQELVFQHVLLVLVFVAVWRSGCCKKHPTRISFRVDAFSSSSLQLFFLPFVVAVSASYSYSSLRPSVPFAASGTKKILPTGRKREEEEERHLWISQGLAVYYDRHIHANTQVNKIPQSGYYVCKSYWVVLLLSCFTWRYSYVDVCRSGMLSFERKGISFCMHRRGRTIK